jgi:hypothetical protein
MVSRRAARGRRAGGWGDAAAARGEKRGFIFPIRLFLPVEPEPCTGVIIRDELSEVIHWLEQVPYRRKKERVFFKHEDRYPARRLLEQMEAAGVDAVDYMPAQLRGLPRHLVERAIDILLSKARYRNMDTYSEKEPFEITQGMLNRYRGLGITLGPLRLSYSKDRDTLLSGNSGCHAASGVS